MSARFCAMCIYRTTNGGKTFCPECYHNNKEEILLALYGNKDEPYVRPEWLKYMEADAEREKRRLEKERGMYQYWYE